MRAILTKGVLGTQHAAVGPAVSGRADASAVHGRALSVVIAVATILALLAVGVEGTRPAAGLAVPSHLARAFPSPGMT